MKDIINKKYNDYLKMYEQCLKYIENSPKGRLSILRRNGHIYFYQKNIENNGEREVIYLNKGKKDVIRALAQKGYYENLKKKLTIVIPLLQKLLQELEVSIDDIYDCLPLERRKLIKPFCPTLKQKVEDWNNKPVLVNNNYSENLRFHTQRGELVRSKSELMIADLLYRNSDKLDYRYEQELVVYMNGEEVILHPDFMVFNIMTGKITYWEHFGRMDDIKYVNQFMKKIELYSSNGLIIGKDIIFTFEDINHPLDSLQIEQAISIINMP